jgi:hypothetical protein
MRKFRQALALAAAVTVGMAAGHGRARAQYFGASALKVESESAQTQRGRPVVRGYVHNLSPYNVTNVRLGVEAIDAGGMPAGPVTTGWVNGEISTNERRYFEVPLERAAAGYRVTVQSFDFRGGKR